MPENGQPMITKTTSAAACILVVALGLGCGARSHSDGPEPIAECVQYQQVFEKCMGRTIRIAQNTAAMAKSDTERERLAGLCSLNLRRIQEGCR